MNDQQKTTRIESCQSCLICGKPGVEKHGQMLPDNGTLINVIHKNGKVCEFVEYPSVSSFLMKRQKKLKDPKIMYCPICRQQGRIGSYRPQKDKQFHKWVYFIVHEQIGGYWGKNHKIKKRRRSYMKTQAQTNKILKRLGRYRS